MTNSWPRIKISNLCELIVDCVNKTAPKVEYETPFKMIRTPNIKKGSINLSGCRSVTQETYEKWTRRATVDEGDVLLTREAPMGEVGLVNFTDTVFLGQRIMQYRANFKKLDSNFLLYSFLSPDLQYQFRRHNSTGSIVSHIKVPDCSEFEISLPDLPEQKKISNVLRNLDKKIELNNKINTELEAMAKLIYDYWFVQFDFPDANGKPYKSTGGKMVYNGVLKREVPDGWGVFLLDDIVDVISDTVTPRDICSSTAYIGLEHMPRKTIVFSKWETAEKVDSNKSAFKKKDILFGKIRPYFHKVGIGFIDGITSTDTIVLRAKKSELHGVALQTVFTEKFVETATLSSTGTKMPRANWNVLKNYRVPVPAPSNDLLNSYQTLFDNCLVQMETLIYQNNELTKLRDWLLPMLMNGQVTVKESSQ